MMTELLIRFRLLLLLTAGALAAVLAAGALQTGFDTRIEVLLGANDPYYLERNNMAELFPEQPTINFAVIPTDTELDIFSPAVLNALGELHFAYRQIPYVERASSVVALDSPFGEIGLVPGRFRRFETVAPETLQRARDKAMNDNFIRGILVSEDASLAMFVITLREQNYNSLQNRAISDAVQVLLTRLRDEFPEVAFYASAEALYETATRDAMIQDLTQLLPLVVMCCIILICYCFRSVLHGLAILLVTLLTVSSTVGLFGWMHIAFNSVSVMAPLVVVIIVVATTAHILSVYRQQLGLHDSKSTAMTQSVRFNLQPVTLATVTTAIGFASLNYASAPAISQFGSIVACGVLFTWLYSFTIFPVVVIWMPGKSGEVRLAAPFLRACQRLTARHEAKVFYGTIVIGLIAAALLPLNQTDFNRLDFVDRKSGLHDYYKTVSERMNRGNILSWGISTPDAEASSPFFLQQVDTFSQWLTTRDDVLETASLVEVVKTINQTIDSNRGINPDDAYRLPETQAAIEQHLSNYLSVQRSAYSLNRFVNDRNDTIRLLVTTTPLSNQQLINLDREMSAHFNQTLAINGLRLIHGSDTLLFARMDESVTWELIQSYGISLLMITLALTIGLRSWYFGLISVVPNLLPATLVFGAWALLVGRIDPFVMMLFSISIGLVVDDTVHMISTYQRHREQGLSIDQSLQSAINKAGPALTITTLVLALGTFILLFASTLYFQQAARLLVPIVVIALILDLTFLPALLARLEPLRLRLRAAK
jgi:uncharacterized protein